MRALGFNSQLEVVDAAAPAAAAAAAAPDPKAAATPPAGLDDAAGAGQTPSAEVPAAAVSGGEAGRRSRGLGALQGGAYYGSTYNGSAYQASRSRCGRRSAHSPSPRTTPRRAGMGAKAAPRPSAQALRGLEGRARLRPPPRGSSGLGRAMPRPTYLLLKPHHYGQAHRRAGDALLALGRGEAAARSMAKAAAIEHALAQKQGQGHVEGQGPE